MSADEHLSPQQFNKGDIVEHNSGGKRKRIALDKDAQVKENGYVKLTGNRARVKDNVVTDRFDVAYGHHSTMRKVGRWG